MAGRTGPGESGSEGDHPTERRREAADDRAREHRSRQRPVKAFLVIGALAAAFVGRLGVADGARPVSVTPLTASASSFAASSSPFPSASPLNPEELVPTLKRRVDMLATGLIEELRSAAKIEHERLLQEAGAPTGRLVRKAGFEGAVGGKGWEEPGLQRAVGRYFALRAASRDPAHDQAWVYAAFTPLCPTRPHALHPTEWERFCTTGAS